jgi:hypothetical protein
VTIALNVAAGTISSASSGTGGGRAIVPGDLIDPADERTVQINFEILVRRAQVRKRRE